jgi:hypothetical protein
MMEDPSVQNVPGGAGENTPRGPDVSDEQSLVRCVVLSAPGQATGPSDLIRALRRKQLALQTASNTFEAMAHLVRRLDDTIPAAHRGMALVIVEPNQQPDGTLHGMLAALARYAPLTTLWAYDATASPRLHSYVPGDGDRSMQGQDGVEIHVTPDIGKKVVEASRQRSARGMAKPPLRLAGEGQIPGADPDSLDDTIDPSMLMSEDELSMLLDDEDVKG